MDDLKSILIPAIIAVFIVVVLHHRRVSAHQVTCACGLFLIPFGLAILGCFPSMDDWCYADSGRQDWWSCQRDWYLGWSGRIGATAVLSSWGLIGSSWFASVVMYRLILLLLMTCLVLVLWDLGKALLRTASEKFFLQDQFLVTMAITVGWVSAMPDPTEGLFWLAGAATYSAGAVFGVLAVSSVLHACRPTDSGPVWRWRAAVVAASLAPLFSEIVAVLVCSALGIMAMVTPGRNRWRIAAPFLASLLGLAIVSLAPGNIVRSIEAARQGQVSGSHELVPLVSDGVGMAFQFLADSPLAFPAILALLVATQVSFKDRPGSIRAAMGILLATAVMVVVAALPLAWTGMSPLRAWNPVSLVVAIGLVAFAVHGGPNKVVIACLCSIAGASLVWQTWTIQGGMAIFFGGWFIAGLAIFRWGKDVPFAAITAALSVGLLLGSPRFIEACRDVFFRGPAYVLAQQRRLDALAISVRGSTVRVDQLPEDRPYFFHHEDIDFNEKTWQNQSQASFFGLASLRAVPPPLAPMPVTSPTHSGP